MSKKISFSHRVLIKILQLWMIAHWLKHSIDTLYHYYIKHKAVKEHINKISNLPGRLHIEGTNVCNARCVFCAYPIMKRTNHCMTMEDFKKVIDEYTIMGGAYIALTPVVGDPFMDPYLMSRFEYLDQHPVIRGFYFFTNAILMKPEVTDRLFQFNDKLMVFVSLGGFDRETYKMIMGIDKYDTVVSNLKYFINKKRKTGCGINMEICLRVDPFRRKGDFWRWLKERRKEGLIAISEPTGFDNWGGGKHNSVVKNTGLPSALKPLHLGPCHFLYDKPVIFADLSVGACASRDIEGLLRIGNLKEESLEDIWYSKRIQNIIRSHEMGQFPEICKGCTHYVSIYDSRSTVWQQKWNWSEVMDNSGSGFTREVVSL